MKRLIKVWLILASRELQSQLITKWSGILFIIGKIVRFFLYFVFLFSVLTASKTLAGYNREQVILFFLVFTLVDTIIQFLFRGVYTFRTLIVSGNFDLDLVKPLPSFFRPLFGYPDILDLVTLIPLWIYFFFFTITNHLLTGFLELFVFFIFLANSLVLGFAFHLFISAVCVLTTEIDHLIWVYRDLSTMARFPTDIYQKFIQYILTFAIPIIILITVPAKAFLGLLSWPLIFIAFGMTLAFLLLSFKFWHYALSKYSSASS